MIKIDIPYSTQWVDDDDIKAVGKILNSRWITQGPKIDEFEEKLAKYVGARYAIAVSSGTAALNIACLIGGIGPEDEVIVPTLSFVATSNCVLYCGASPVLVDVYKDTLTINVEEVKKKITKRTKAIIAVDFAGHPAEWHSLAKIAKKSNLLLIADSAHALGSIYQGKNVGSIADITTFSFHPVKTITTGEGGAITTDNKVFAEKARQIRNHGIIKSNSYSKRFGGWYYQIERLGYNFRITDFQAALGISQLKKIESFIKRRRQIWRRYNEAFSKLEGLILPIEEEGCFCAWHLYPICIKKAGARISRRQVYDKLRQLGIGVQVHYLPIHLLSLYKKLLGHKKGDFPVAESYYDQALSLPLFPSMSNFDQTKVIQSLKSILNKK